jgi:hypothetical protein
MAGDQFEVVFTAPWDPIAFRRGDALGLRAFTDELAERIAPGLSNRTWDARWISLLAWCLFCSDAAWRQSGGRAVSTRVDAASRYAWLRPLELMWVARTLSLTSDDGRGRQLPGQRRVRIWLAGNRRSPQFAMSSDQYRGYRQTGPYGAYRVVFRRTPGLTIGGDGWSPGPIARALADRVEDNLGSARIGLRELTQERARWGAWAGKEDVWWQKRWESFIGGSARTAERTLPTQRDKPTRIEEYEQIRELLFGEKTRVHATLPNAARRRKVADVMAATRATTHGGLCAEIARKLRHEAPEIQILPAFSRLADRGIELMEASYGVVHRSGSPKGMAVRDLLDEPEIRRGCDALRAAAVQWQKRESSFDAGFRHVGSADRFANAVNQRSSLGVLRGLLSHHRTAGGGLRWLYLHEDRAVLNSAFQIGESARYGFRLWALARLAIQCGVLHRLPTGVARRDVAEGDLLEEEGA